MGKKFIVITITALILLILAGIGFFMSNSMGNNQVIYVGYKKVMATVFWVGELANEDNGFIANDKSAFDSKWQENFGGVDLPNDRCGYYPCGFTPKENPFYVALPYSDLDNRGKRKKNAELIPWFEKYAHLKSVMKNRWVEIIYNDKTCYGQIEDVGPFKSDDFKYVFGSSRPKNKINFHAGIDISPAMRDCLGMTTNSEVYWQFIDDSNVPEGPWKDNITTSPVSF